MRILELSKKILRGREMIEFSYWDLGISTVSVVATVALLSFLLYSKQKPFNQIEFHLSDVHVDSERERPQLEPPGNREAIRMKFSKIEKSIDGLLGSQTAHASSFPLESRSGCFGSFTRFIIGEFHETTPYGRITIGKPVREYWMELPNISQLFSGFLESDKDIYKLIAYCACAESTKSHPLVTEYLWATLLRDTDVSIRADFLSPKSYFIYGSFTKVVERYIVYSCPKTYMLVGDFVTKSMASLLDHIQDSCRVLAELINIVHEIHDMGIVHGDINESSVLVDRDSMNVRLIKFHNTSFSKDTGRDYDRVILLAENMITHKQHCGKFQPTEILERYFGTLRYLRQVLLEDDPKVIRSAFGHALKDLLIDT
jgi:hypothetical protein